MVISYLSGSHVCLLGLDFLGVCSVECVKFRQRTSSELVCDLLLWVAVSAKKKKRDLI